MRGRFITFEGVEGCGKTTQLKRAQQYLEQRGCTVLATREPGGSRLGEAIRAILLDPNHPNMAASAELLLYAAARAQHVSEIIRPAIAAGRFVLCDRYADSTTAYQGAGRRLAPEDLAVLHGIATGGLQPDLTILLDLPVEIGLERAHLRGHYDRIEQEALDFHARVRQGFLAIAEREPGRVRVVDAVPDQETVAAEVRRHLDSLFGASREGEEP